MSRDLHVDELIDLVDLAGGNGAAAGRLLMRPDVAAAARDALDAADAKAEAERAVTAATAARDAAIRRMAVAGLSMRAIGTIVGLTAPTISHIVSGRRDRP